MKTIIITILFISLLGILSISVGCRQEALEQEALEQETMEQETMEQEVVKTDSDPQEVMESKQLLERYLLETEKLREKFDPISERLKKEAVIRSEYGASPDYERWYQEYDLPLFEAVKSAMERVTGTDDYLKMWENQISERIGTLTLEHQDELGIGTVSDKTIVVSHRSYYLGDSISLLTLHTLGIVHDNQVELTPGIFFRISEDEKILPRSMMGGSSGNPEGFGPTRFPPIPLVNIFRSSAWEVMAIYSFKNERARDLLFQMFEKDDSPRAGYAASYLPFFPDSGELLPKVKALLQNEIDEEQENNPDRAKRYIDENGKLINPFRQYTGSWQKINGMDSSDWWQLMRLVPRIFHLIQLVRSLEFNEKIPAEERERFDIFRRELMISRLSQSPSSEASIQSIATLKKGDEHFEIYLVEYGGFPSFRNIQWESDDFSSPYSLKNPYWQKRKEFYERELANPREIYTDNQMEYIRDRIKELERFP